MEDSRELRKTLDESTATLKAKCISLLDQIESLPKVEVDALIGAMEDYATKKHFEGFCAGMEEESKSGFLTRASGKVVMRTLTAAQINGVFLLIGILVGMYLL